MHGSEEHTHVLQLIQLPQLGRQSAGQPVFREIPVEDAEKIRLGDRGIEQTMRSDRQEGHCAARKERGGLSRPHVLTGG